MKTIHYNLGGLEIETAKGVISGVTSLKNEMGTHPNDTEIIQKPISK